LANEELTTNNEPLAQEPKERSSVTQWRWLATVIASYLALGVCAAPACQYNVREVGFADAGVEAYRLIVYLPESTPGSEISSLQETMAAALAETNIRFEPVTAGADANQTAMEIAKTHGSSRFPAAVLVAPEGQSLSVTWPEGAASLAETALSAVESLLDSGTGRQILETCADTYGTVLLIEGPDPRQNEAARAAACAAINRIGEHLESLPKPIGKPPALVVLEQKVLAREQVLLWTLGLKAEDVKQPCAAVFYGRGRWIGPLFQGETLKADNLTQLLSVIGADCECSLDHQWLQGTMLPARWDGALQQRVVQSTGLDPESPMTKMEMISIVRRGMGGSGYSGVPFDYREVQVGDDPNEGRGQGIADRRQKATPSSVLHPSSSRIVGQVLVGSLTGVAVLAGLTSLVIVWRARKS
jgi:hypothetical protein